MTTQGNDLKGATSALAYARKALGRTLRAAREKGGLSVARLAQKLYVTTAAISAVEDGRLNADEHYVARWLDACGLPPHWKAPRVRRTGRKPRTAR